MLHHDVVMNAIFIILMRNLHKLDFDNTFYCLAIDVVGISFLQESFYFPFHFTSHLESYLTYSSFVYRTGYYGFIVETFENL